jgi:hypothetical protein
VRDSVYILGSVGIPVIGMTAVYLMSGFEFAVIMGIAWIIVEQGDIDP